MLRIIAIATLLLAPVASRAGVDPRAVAPGGVIIEGLVPANTGGCWNGPTTTIIIPAGRTFVLYASGVNTQDQSSMAGLSISYPASSHTYAPNGVTYVWAGLGGDIAYTMSAMPPDQYHNLLYFVGTQACPPDGHQAIAFMCGQIPLDGGGYPFWEGAENQLCTGRGPALQSQSAQFQGNGLGIVSSDPTNFKAEGIGGTALEVNPQIYTGRVVLSRPPQPNDYISQYGMYGQCAETYQQGLGCQYGSIITRIRNPNATGRDAEVDIATIDPANSGGTGTLPRLSLTAQGIACADVRGNTPGAFMGSRTVNCDDYYIGGISLKELLIRAGILTQADLRGIATRQSIMPAPETIKAHIPPTPKP